MAHKYLTACFELYFSLSTVSVFHTIKQILPRAQSGALFYTNSQNIFMHPKGYSSDSPYVQVMIVDKDGDGMGYHKALEKALGLNNFICNMSMRVFRESVNIFGTCLVVPDNRCCGGKNGIDKMLGELRALQILDDALDDFPWGDYLNA